MGMKEHFLTALPVFNERRHVDGVLAEVRKYSPDVLVVDDGSTDGTSDVLDRWPNIGRITHNHNRGYGAALQSAFQYAVEAGYDVLVTIDCDGQHQPQRIPAFVEACRKADIVSGSRYLEPLSGDSRPPADRRHINRVITDELNERLGLHLTDAFCGFKAYRTAVLGSLRCIETGYAMPLEVWVRAAALELKIIETPVPLIYLEEKRSFGGALDVADTRLAVYRQVIDRVMVRRSQARRPSAACCEEGMV